MGRKFYKVKKKLGRIFYRVKKNVGQKFYRVKKIVENIIGLKKFGSEIL